MSSSVVPRRNRLLLGCAALLVVAVPLRPRLATALLAEAVPRDQTPLIRLALRLGADANVAVPVRETPGVRVPVLVTAARSGNREAVGALLRAGARPDALATDGRTALVAAVESHPDAAALELARTLLDAGADPGAAVNRGALAAAVRRPEVLREMLRRGVVQRAPTAVPEALTAAARTGNRPAYDLLVAAGARPTLYAAALLGDSETVAALLREGAKPDTPGISISGAPETPLAVAFGRRDARMALLLVEAEAARHTRPGETLPLFQAADAGLPAVARRLLARGESVTATDREGRTALFACVLPLRYADAGGNAERVSADAARLLLDAGAEVRRRDIYGRTPLWYAAMSHNLSVARLLLDRGADPNAGDDSDVTPLMAAIRATGSDRAQDDAVAMANLLVRRGARPDARERGGETALSLLKRRNPRATRVAEALRGLRPAR